MEFYNENLYFKRVLDDFKENIRYKSNGIIDNETVRQKLFETCQKITGERIGKVKV